MFSLNINKSMCTRTCRAFSTELFTTQLGPSPYCCVSYSGCRSSHLYLLNLVQIFLSPPASWLTCLCGGSSFWLTSFHFGTSHKLGEGAVTLVVQIIPKTLNSIGPSIHPDKPSSGNHLTLELSVLARHPFSQVGKLLFHPSCDLSSSFLTCLPITTCA